MTKGRGYRKARMKGFKLPFAPLIHTVVETREKRPNPRAAKKTRRAAARAQRLADHQALMSTPPMANPRTFTASPVLLDAAPAGPPRRELLELPKRIGDIPSWLLRNARTLEDVHHLNAMLSDGKVQMRGKVRRVTKGVSAAIRAPLVASQERETARLDKRQATIARRLEVFERRLRSRPPWVVVDDLLRFEAHRDHMKKVTGRVHHVDHIIPINGVTDDGFEVCGLDVPWNLEVLAAGVNMSKGNKVPMDRILATMDKP